MINPPPYLPIRLERFAFRAFDALSDFLEEAAKLTLDHLTQLPNREAGERLFRAEQIAGHPLLAGVGDFDHFKNVNDSFGHITGDDCLRAGARIFDSFCLPHGASFRFGGEEIGFCLRSLSLVDAVAVVEDVREAVERLVIVPRTEPELRVSFTISIGVTAVRPDESFENAFGRADRALYDAKRAGRNRVCFVE